MKILIFITILFFTSFPTNAGTISLDNLANSSRGKVLFIRHALAPGNGDPFDFKIGDCSTQRNLNDEGIKQAIQIGKKIKKAGIKVSKVYSSQWCRCLDTAKFLNIGNVAPFSGLNSFYDLAEKETEYLSRLRKLLKELNKNSDLVIMVTHYVTISAITNKSIDSGGGVVLSLKTHTSQEIEDL